MAVVYKNESRLRGHMEIGFVKQIVIRKKYFKKNEWSLNKTKLDFVNLVCLQKRVEVFENILQCKQNEPIKNSDLGWISYG